MFNRLGECHPRLQDEFEEEWSPQYIGDSIPHPDNLRILLLPFLNALLYHTAHLLRPNLLAWSLVVRVTITGVIIWFPGHLAMCLAMLRKAPLFEGSGADPEYPA